VFEYSSSLVWSLIVVFVGGGASDSTSPDDSEGDNVRDISQQNLQQHSSVSNHVHQYPIQYSSARLF
jgi:hypothetical protein